MKVGRMGIIIAAALALDTGGSNRANAAQTCRTLAGFKIPDITITLAEIVDAGAFKPPAAFDPFWPRRRTHLAGSLLSVLCSGILIVCHCILFWPIGRAMLPCMDIFDDVAQGKRRLEEPVAGTDAFPLLEPSRSLSGKRPGPGEYPDGVN